MKVIMLYRWDGYDDKHIFGVAFVKDEELTVFTSIVRRHREEFKVMDKDHRANWWKNEYVIHPEYFERRDRPFEFLEHELTKTILDVKLFRIDDEEEIGS